MTLAKTASGRLSLTKFRRVARISDGGLASRALALLLLPGLAIGGAAAAQTILPPAPPPGGPVQGPPDGGIPPGPPVRLPTPTPAPSPTPVPSPTPAPGPTLSPDPDAAPERTASPRPAPVRPRERPQQAEQQPAAADAPRPLPADPAANAPGGDGDEPAPVVADESEGEQTPVGVDATPGRDGSRWPDDLLFGLLGALAAAGIGFWWWSRRRRISAASEVRLTEPPPALAEPPSGSAPPPAPSPAASSPATAQPTALNKVARPAAAHQAHIRVDVEPLAASTTLVNLRMRYVLVVYNQTDADVAITGHADTVLAGRNAQEAMIRQWFDTAPLTGGLSGTVPAHGELRLERELVVPLGTISAMQVRGKPVLIPVLLLALAYRHATGLGQIGRAFVVGKPGQSAAKLGALPLDQGMGGFGALGARDTEIAANN